MPGIVIVTYNSGYRIGRCLDACLGLVGADIVVVDNASIDSTLSEVKRRPEVRLIANATNRGFAAAVNQGIESVATENVLVLNPDTVIRAGIAELDHALSSSQDVGAGTGTLTNADGEPQHGFNVRRFPTPLTLTFELLGLNRLWPSNPVNRRYRMQLSADSQVDIDQPAGAFLMIKRLAWKTIGGFDEGFYPVWFEDVDFCKRLRNEGFRIIYFPPATAEHAGGDSVGQMPWIIRQQVWYGSLLRYSSKHYSRRAGTVLAMGVVIGCTVRSIVRALTQLSLEPFAACSKVVRLTSHYLRLGELAGTSQAACPATKESKSRFLM
jgi:N-acetylglucosaminyl-diphospho-decaprenol L-rhamnosyltransferase